MYSHGWVIFENRLVLRLNRLLCGEHLLGAGYVELSDFSSLMEGLTKKLMEAFLMLTCVDGAGRCGVSEDHFGCTHTAV